MWVKKPDGAEIRCRLGCKGCYQETTYKDDTYASAQNPGFNLDDVSTASLHAELCDEVYVRPPVVLNPDGNCFMATSPSSRPPPKAWQPHFAETTIIMGSNMLGANKMCHWFPDKELSAVPYVDEILTVGLQDSAVWFYSELSKLLLIKHLRELLTGGKDIVFLARLLRRDAGGIHLQAPRSYTTEMIDLLGFKSGKSVNRAQSTTRLFDGWSESCSGWCLSGRI